MSFPAFLSQYHVYKFMILNVQFRRIVTDALKLVKLIQKDVIFTFFLKKYYCDLRKISNFTAHLKYCSTLLCNKQNF